MSNVSLFELMGGTTTERGAQGTQPHHWVPTLLSRESWHHAPTVTTRGDVVEHTLEEVH
jgi:hypothetical protein